MMSVGQEGENDSLSAKANSIPAGGRRCRDLRLGGCRMKALPDLIEKLNKTSTEFFSLTGVLVSLFQARLDRGFELKANLGPTEPCKS